MNKRIFAFGCSFTEYIWPTWADIIGRTFNKEYGYEYYNFGNSGSGNYYILNSLFWADKKYNFTTDDIIMVMWSSWSREDRYIIDYNWDPGLRGQWTKEGNILNAAFDSKYFTEDFFRYWSLENDIANNVLSIELARKLYNIDFEEHIAVWEGSAELDEKRSKLELPEAIYQMFLKKSNDVQNSCTWQKINELYNGKIYKEGKTRWQPEPYIKTVNKHDAHPVPMAHLDYVREAVPTIRGLETITRETEIYIKGFSDRMRILVTREGWDDAATKINDKHLREQKDYCAGIYIDLWHDAWPLDMLRTFTPKGK